MGGGHLRRFQANLGALEGVRMTQRGNCGERYMPQGRNIKKETAVMDGCKNRANDEGGLNIPT